MTTVNLHPMSHQQLSLIRKTLCPSFKNSHKWTNRIFRLVHRRNGTRSTWSFFMDFVLTQIGMHQVNVWSFFVGSSVIVHVTSWFISGSFSVLAQTLYFFYLLFKIWWGMYGGTKLGRCMQANMFLASNLSLNLSNLVYQIFPVAIQFNVYFKCYVK